ncbi:MAG: S9 family peptidase [Bacteroidales bacterium]|jgi:dipeptidyl-peptidase-4|nr:S9 family peptidase [Bacteroidales bacterium]
MKRKLYLLPILFFIGLLPISLISQEKLTLADAARTNPKVYAQRLSSLQWMGNSDFFVYVSHNALVKSAARNGKKDTILRIQDLNDALSAIEETPLNRFPAVRFIDDDNFMFKSDNKFLQYNLQEKSVRILNYHSEKGENVDIHHKTSRIAYTMGNNLFINIAGNVKMITSDKDPGVVNGQAAHRFEFGIEKGTFWSPNGEKLAFYRKDETKVSKYPIVDVSKRVAEELPIRYPMAGMDSEEVLTAIYDVAHGTTIFLKPQPDSSPDQYWTHITWTPDSKYIIAAIVNRDQNRMQLCRFDGENGNYLNTIYTETNSRYVEPMHDPYFLPNSNTNFLWVSRRDGYSHFYFMDINGGNFRQVTEGEWEVLDVAGFDAKGENVFFTATKESPLQRNIYSCHLKNGKITRISPNHGTHYALLNKKGNLILDTFSSTDVPYAVKVEDAKGKVLQTVFESPNPFENYELGEMTIDKIKSDNGADLYYRLIKPVGFDPDKKYPAIIYVYGGPHHQLISDSWLGGNDLFLFYLAQEGYVVFTLDNQGSANRGFDFESIIHCQVGVQEVKDQMTGFAFLKQFPWVDQSRIGVDGWSYGGFMTINMLLSHPGVFKAGCAGGPVCDWKYYETMYGERYMNTPQQNPEGYKNSSLIERAGILQDHLLIIHGDQDSSVVWQHSLEFVKKCVDEGILLDYFVYPGHEHNVKGKDRIHLYKKIVAFFDLYLK